MTEAEHIAEVKAAWKDLLVKIRAALVIGVKPSRLVELGMPLRIVRQAGNHLVGKDVDSEIPASLR